MNKLILLVTIYLVTSGSPAFGNQCPPDELANYMQSMRNEYRLVEIEAFTDHIIQHTKSPHCVAADFNGDDKIDYIAIVKGKRGPTRLIGFVNIEGKEYSHHYLHTIYTYEGKIKLRLLLYLNPTATGLDESGAIDDWKTIDLENSGALLRYESGLEQVIYWLDGKFRLLSSEG